MPASRSSSADPAAASRPAPPRGRDPWLDNAKMALVTLVVIGHAWTLLPLEGAVGWMYDFLYLWHMPAFVMITGYLSRGFTYRPDRLIQLVQTVAVPYLIFECAMALFRVYVGGEDLDGLFADPHWPLWFLAALFCWRLLTPIFRPMYGGLVVAILMSLAAGVAAGDTLDLARVLGMLPFFVLGLKATPERLELLRGALPRIAGVLVFAGLAVVATTLNSWASTEWLYYRSTYGELDVSALEAVLTRGALLGMGMAGAFAFLAWVPRVPGTFARMGKWTLVVYLFHGFVVKGVEYTGFPAWGAEHAAAAIVATTLGGLALSLLLATDPLARRLDHLVDPFGAARRRLREAVALTAASVDPVDPIASVDLAPTPIPTADAPGAPATPTPPAATGDPTPGEGGADLESSR